VGQNPTPILLRAHIDVAIAGLCGISGETVWVVKRMLGEADDICAAIREVDKDSEARNTGSLAFVAGAVVAKKSDPTKVYVVGLMAANERGHDVDESGVEEGELTVMVYSPGGRDRSQSHISRA
jgi:hypothetical protein